MARCMLVFEGLSSEVVTCSLSADAPCLFGQEEQFNDNSDLGISYKYVCI